MKVTITPTNTPIGTAGYKITCPCTTHKGHGNSAIVGFKIDPNKVHGTVLMANHPAAVIRTGAARRNIWAA